MKLPSKEIPVDTSDFTITKDGKLLRKGKELSKAYEKKYASDAVSNYRFVIHKDKKETIRDSKGRFVSKPVSEKVKHLIVISEKRTTKRIKDEKIAPYGRKLKGSFMKANYAITSICTCQVMKAGYKGEKAGQIIKHYYTISTNDRLTYGEITQSHNADYPDHDLIDVKVTSTKEVSFK